MSEPTKKLIKPRKLHLESTLDFGKYKGRTVRDLIVGNPGYFVWIAANVDSVTLMPDVVEVLSVYAKTNKVVLPPPPFANEELNPLKIAQEEIARVEMAERAENSLWGSW